MAGIEFDPSVLLIGMAKGDPWYTDIFCIPACPTTGALKERFQKFNTGGDRGPLKLGQVSCLLTVFFAAQLSLKLFSESRLSPHNERAATRQLLALQLLPCRTVAHASSKSTAPCME